MDTYIPLEKLKSHRRKEMVKKIFSKAKEATVKGIRAGASATTRGVKVAVRKAKESAPHIKRNLERGREGMIQFSKTMEKYAPRQQANPFGNMSPISGRKTKKKGKAKTYNPFNI